MYKSAARNQQARARARAVADTSRSPKRRNKRARKDWKSVRLANLEAFRRRGVAVRGKVSRLESYGAFVDLDEEVIGLIHISEIANEFVEDVSDHLRKGQTVSVRVISVDDRRVSLSLLDVPEAVEDDDGNRTRRPKQGSRNEQRRRLVVCRVCMAKVRFDRLNRHYKRVHGE